MDTLPNTIHVVHEGHNRITISVMPPHQRLKDFRCGFKSTRGFDLNGPGWSPVYWYSCFDGLYNFVTMLRKFTFEPNDELVISSHDYLYLKPYFDAPVFDLSKKTVHTVANVDDAIREHDEGIFIKEPKNGDGTWEDYKRGQGIWSGPGQRSSPDELATFLRHDNDITNVFMSAAALEILRPVFAEPALPVRVSHRRLPERVYETPRTGLVNMLKASIRWHAHQ